MLWDYGGLTAYVVGNLIVTFVAFVTVRVGLWDHLWDGEPMAYFFLSVFCYHTVLIYLCHYRILATEPGYIPKNYEELDI